MGRQAISSFVVKAIRRAPRLVLEMREASIRAQMIQLKEFKLQHLDWGSIAHGD